jgi:hypothetical protein
MFLNPDSGSGIVATTNMRTSSGVKRMTRTHVSGCIAAARVIRTPHMVFQNPKMLQTPVSRLGLLSSRVLFHAIHPGQQEEQLQAATRRGRSVGKAAAAAPKATLSNPWK